MCADCVTTGLSVVQTAKHCVTASSENLIYTHIYGVLEGRLCLCGRSCYHSLVALPVSPSWLVAPPPHSRINPEVKSSGYKLDRCIYEVPSGKSFLKNKRVGCKCWVGYSSRAGETLNCFDLIRFIYFCCSGADLNLLYPEHRWQQRAPEEGNAASDPNRDKRLQDTNSATSQI